ncbi:hypothetical protein Taro_011951 [Colocasia esculenta]|uniref:Uncharacterized protein n=1 Tax=Colocasia esculenta TaxID=4460 RepID=A0A843UHN4_COLES|nr:hypothetical protein [Colocasia esculenta]
MHLEEIRKTRPRVIEMEIERCHTLQFPDWFKGKVISLQGKYNNGLDANTIVLKDRPLNVGKKFNLTADWFLREEYEKFREDLQGKRIHIDAQSATTSKDKILDIKLMKQSCISSSIASVGDAYEQVLGRDRTGRVCGIGTSPTPKSLWGSRSEQKLCQDNESLKQQIDALEERMKKFESRGNNEDSLAGRRVRILNFFGQVVASCILMSDDNDNVVMGKKLGGEYYEVSILIAHDPTASLTKMQIEKI